MSYALADANGYLGDLTTIGGWKLFREWAYTQEPTVRRFSERGVSEDPKALAAALRKATAVGDVAELRDTIATLADQADEIVILSDGEAA